MSTRSHQYDERAAGAVVVRQCDAGGWECVLIQQHNGDWGLPKGHVEGRERDEETALREVREETGLAVRIDPGFREAVSYTLPNGHAKEVVCFLARVESGVLTPQPEEVREAGWFSFADAGAKARYPAVRGVLAQAQAHLRRDTP